MKRFNNKYRIASARLPEYDYSISGNYFITICTLGRMQYFGKIKNEEMILSDIGKIIEELIPEISKQFPEVKIGEYIIMPDHLHIIVRINDPNRINDENSETRLIASLQSEEIKTKGGITGDNNPMSKNGIPRIIRWFKGRATFEIRKTNKEFSWQPRYYDRIIRDTHEYYAIIEYIKSNPANWDNDM